MNIFKKARRKLTKLRLTPIPVFVFHQVSDTFDSSTMWKNDWTETELFKNNILELNQKYHFISLTEAHSHLKKDFIRLKKYAVLTCDDGWSSITNIIPWLMKHHIPVTLFLNPAYLKGEQSRENNMNGLLNTDDIRNLLTKYPQHITIGSHGWNHDICTEQDMEQFTKSVKDSDTFLSQFGSSYIKFFAYPCGKHNQSHDLFLRENNIIPVYCDGTTNIANSDLIHRQCIDQYYYNNIK